MSATTARTYCAVSRCVQVAEGGVLPLLHKKFAQPQDIFYIK
jgi:hypothetical protein